MENDQRAKLDSYQRVQDFNDEYKTDLAAIEDYGDLQTEFDTIVGKIVASAGQQQETTGVTAELLEETKRNMAEMVFQFASRGAVKAALKSNAELANQLDKPVTYLFKAEKNISLQRALNLRNLMNDNLAALTNIKPENITTIDTAMNAYADMMNKPLLQIQRKKSHGTDVLPPLIKKADKLVDSMFSLVKSYFFKNNAELVDAMELAMQVINTGIRHTLVNITVLAAEDNTVLEDAIALDNGNGKSYESDHTGLVHIDRHTSGHDTFTISAAGRQEVTVEMDIKRATDNKLTVKLVKV